MTKEKTGLEFKLIPIDEMPLEKKKRKTRKIKIDVKENEYLEKIGRKPKQQKMTANYIQNIYKKMEKKKR